MKRALAVASARQGAPRTCRCIETASEKRKSGRLGVSGSTTHLQRVRNKEGYSAGDRGSGRLRGARAGADVVDPAEAGDCLSHGARGGSGLSESVAKTPAGPGRTRRNVDIPRFCLPPIPPRGVFTTDSDTPRPEPPQKLHTPLRRSLNNLQDKPPLIRVVHGSGRPPAGRVFRADWNRIARYNSGMGAIQLTDDELHILQGITFKVHVGKVMIAPHKKPSNGEPDEVAKKADRGINRIRQVIEQAIVHIKARRTSPAPTTAIPCTHSNRQSPPYPHSVSSKPPSE